MNYQELIDTSKKYYKESNLKLSYEYYTKMFDLLDSKLDKCNNQEERYNIYREFNNYTLQIESEMLYKITDYGKEKAYRDKLYNKPYLKLIDITNDSKMSVLDDFCNFYEWGILESNNKYIIFDIQCGCYIDSGNEFDINSLINRIVDRAIDYYKDEEEETDDEYANKLLEIATKYAKKDKWEQKWLEDFKNSLKSVS